jgi:hypothetical protein
MPVLVQMGRSVSNAPSAGGSIGMADWRVSWRWVARQICAFSEFLWKHPNEKKSPQNKTK